MTVTDQTTFNCKGTNMCNYRASSIVFIMIAHTIQVGICVQHILEPVCASTQSDQSLFVHWLRIEHSLVILIRLRGSSDLSESLMGENANLC